MDFKIKNMPNNPRTMSSEARSALKKSMETFEDISGIVLNSKTGNLIAGNHRWDTLKEKYKKLSFYPLIENKLYSILHSGSIDTGFLLKVVDWDETKEKAANISANSELIMGEFTTDLQPMLASIMDFNEFNELRLDEIAIGLDFDSLESNTVQEPIDKPKKKKEVKEKSDIEEPSNVKNILGQIKISVEGDILDDVKEDLVTYISLQEYADQVRVL